MDNIKNFFEKNKSVFGVILAAVIVLGIIYLVYTYMPENMDNTNVTSAPTGSVAILPDGTASPITILPAASSPTSTPIPVVTMSNGSIAPIVSSDNGTKAIMTDGGQIPVTINGVGNFTCPPAADLSGLGTLELENQTLQGSKYTAGNSSGGVMPSDLLPKDTAAAKFDKQFSSAVNDLSSQQFLTAGWTTGINTVGGSLKNPNISIRGDPPIPKIDTPWLQSSYEPDLYRRGMSFC